MEDRETPRMHKYGESKSTRILMETVRRVTSSSGLRNFQVASFFLNRGYLAIRSAGAYTVLLYFPTLSHKRDDFRKKKKKGIKHKIVF